MKGLKGVTIWTLAAGVFLSLIPLYFYWQHFSFSTELSRSKPDWGTFGDFVGGTINPIIGLLNLALLVIVSFAIARFDDNRQINEYRYRIYTDLCSTFDQVESKSANIQRYVKYLEQFMQFNQFLFPNRSNTTFNLVMDRLIEDTNALLIVIQDDEDHTTTFAVSDSLPITHKQARAFLKAMGPAPENNISIAWRDVQQSQMRLCSFIQAVMIGGDLEAFIPPPKVEINT